jgi:hypothetical protein
MKQFFIYVLIAALPFSIAAQGNSGNKGKGKDKAKEAKVKGNEKEDDDDDEKEVKENKGRKHEDVIWEGTKDKGGKGPKPSKNQPAKVRAAFQRDYPNATNVSWSKYRGDWTATFRGGLYTSTAVYHANGQRRDTRTVVERREVPNVILDDILKRNPQTRLEDVIKIEVPQQVKDIFRIKTILDGVKKFIFYDADGKPVQYNY